MSFTKFIIENHPDPDSLLYPKIDQMMILAEKYAESLQSLQSCVSGSFNVDEVKDLLWYGETRDLKVILKDNPRKSGGLDLALDMMFDLLEKHTYLDRKRVENIFWNRVIELANYR